MADVPEQLQPPDEVQIEPQFGIEVVIQSFSDLAIQVSRARALPTIDQGAGILALCQQLRQGFAKLQQEQVGLQQALADTQKNLQQARADLQQTRGDLQQQLANTQLEVQNLRDENARLERNAIARTRNQSAIRGNTPLEPFYGLDGQLIPGFPATVAVARGLKANRLDPLILALGLQGAGTLADRRDRFMRFIGLPD
ncbi:hypothetical protein C7212DRAFT_275954 [Tuber magnatum]|uniref:Uncharacterized protein n=1 Tax=Tuber magnatum TaxID=42249 RepID=A0A317SZ92_9PEZI|nr:hypothetical protein C7212DRAFT_275954 [Tuber magnatum]